MWTVGESPSGHKGGAGVKSQVSSAFQAYTLLSPQFGSGFQKTQQSPVAQGTNKSHQRNGQDVEYISFFVSLISKK